MSFAYVIAAQPTHIQLLHLRHHHQIFGRMYDDDYYYYSCRSQVNDGRERIITPQHTLPNTVWYVTDNFGGNKKGVSSKYSEEQ